MSPILSLLLLFHSLPAIDEQIPNGPFCYPGAYSREVILVDEGKSPVLASAVKELEQQIQENLSEEEILSLLLDFVSETLFDPLHCETDQLHALIQKSYSPYDEIPLDFFLAAKTGVCRHLALTSTYLTQHLIEKGWLKGATYLVRDELPSGRHAWTLYLTEEEAWILDPTWKLLENGKTETGYSHLCQRYGRRAMERQHLRWK